MVVVVAAVARSVEKGNGRDVSKAKTPEATGRRSQ